MNLTWHCCRPREVWTPDQGKLQQKKRPEKEYQRISSTIPTPFPDNPPQPDSYLSRKSCMRQVGRNPIKISLEQNRCVHVLSEYMLHTCPSWDIYFSIFMLGRLLRFTPPLEKPMFSWAHYSLFICPLLPLCQHLQIKLALTFLLLIFSWNSFLWGRTTDL